MTTSALNKFLSIFSLASIATTIFIDPGLTKSVSHYGTKDTYTINKAQSSLRDSGRNQSGQILISQINCEDPKNVADANTCLGEADQELNQTYQQIIRGLSGEDRKKLITAEQSWIKYRDTNCAFRIRDFPLSTSMGRQFYFFCKARMTRERTEELKR
jgi:uncharacterized protein YecT (DUF1311 family)